MLQDPVVRDCLHTVDMHVSDLGGSYSKKLLPTHFWNIRSLFPLQEYFVSGFNVLVPTVVEALDIPPASATWPASAFSLVISCFLLPMGRLSDMYGGKRLFVIGVGWLVICSIVAGVAQTELMLDLARALQGLGPAAFLPSSVMLLGSVYRPGPRKNLVSQNLPPPPTHRSIP